MFLHLPFDISLVVSCYLNGDYISGALAAAIGGIGIAPGASITKKRVTYDFERLMDGATLLKCSEFGDEIISNMVVTADVDA